MTLSIFRDAFGTRKGITGSIQHARAAEVGAEALDAVQTVVDALTDGEGGRFRVSFSPRVEASTAFQTRNIVISSVPLRDHNLKLREAVEVMVGLTTHEVGHTILTPALQAALEKKYGTPVPAIVHKVGNVLDDIRLERWMSARFPGIGGCFVPTLRYVGSRTIPKGTVVAWKPGLTMAQRFNFMLSATRYRKSVSWLANDATRRERQWWIDWANTYAADPDDVALVVAGIAAAIERLKVKPEDQPDNQPPPEGEGKDEVEPTEDEDEESEPGEGESDDEDDEDGEDWDEDGESDDWSDEDDESESESGDESDDEDEGDESEPGESVPSDEPEEDEGTESESSEGKSKAGESNNEPSEGNDEDEAGNPDRDNLPDDSLDGIWEPHAEDLEPRNTWQDQRLQESIDRERQTERFIDRNGHGKMRVVVE